MVEKGVDMSVHRSKSLVEYMSKVHYRIGSGGVGAIESLGGQVTGRQPQAPGSSEILGG